MRRATIAAALMGLALAVEASGAVAPYRQFKARRTFAPDKGAANPFQKSDVLALDFLTTGFARPDGSDLRVFAGDTGRAADFKVLMAGPGDRLRIAVRMMAGISEYHVCYGGPAAAASKWEPEVGLILETRKFNGGEVGNQQQMRKLVEASGPSFGTGFAQNIFQAFNPFGPNDGYVSVYHGTLFAPKAGEYKFATTSDDASYFYVDGKLVSARSAWGRGPPDARFAGQPVLLAAGAHRIEYLHVQGRDTHFCVAAWEPPGGKFEVIPPSAFPGVFTAKQTALEVTGSPIPIDLACQGDGEVEYESHHLYKVRFRDATPDGQSKAYSPQWFFGDGTWSDERDPEHVYFVPGEYEVSFALVRGSSVARLRQRVVVGPDPERPEQTPDDTAARCYRLVKGYDFRSMDSRNLEAALDFFATLGRDVEIMKAAAALFARSDEVAKKRNYDAAVLLGERLRDVQKKPDEALVVFRAALARETDDANKAKLIRRVGDTLLYALRKPDEAMTEYRRILDTFGKLEDNVVRLAQIRVGDVCKAKSDYDHAVEAYKKAEAMLPYERTHAVENVRRGSFAQSVEDYLARKEFAEAQNVLDVWGWENPQDRIAGQWSLLSARLALARGEKASAQREALDCADTNRAGPYADQLFLLAGRVHLEEGRAPDALALARRVQKDYPESTQQDEAVVLECEALAADRQHHEAVKRAMDAFSRDPQADSAPRLLLIAADSSLAQNDKARAVELLRRLVKDYPRSPLADVAAPKLKALGQ